jgi:uncharacterized membrane protein
MTDKAPETTAPQPKAEKKPVDLFRLCASLYAVYAISLLMECFTWTALPGSIAAIIAVILAYAYRDDARGTPFESHLQWMIRTFWIGGAVYLPVATVVTSAALYMMVDWNSVLQTLEQSPASDPMTIMTSVMDANYGKFMAAALAVFVPFGAWWLWRCWQGYEKLKDAKPMENLKRWY